MHRLTLLLVVGLLLGAPFGAMGQTNQTIGTGCWARGPNVDTSTITAADTQKCLTVLSPNAKAWFVVSGDADGEDNVNANADDGDRDSARLNISQCHSITTQLVKKVGDTNAYEAILMMDVPIFGADGVSVVSNTSTPVCADYDADGDIDCTVQSGDTGIDQDNDATSTNDSLLWDWGPVPADYVWVDTTTSPGTDKVGIYLVTCGGPR
jgi:hypothetical protein